MVYDLSEIKKIRKNLGLTQFQLSKQADVSQSLIAKIEAGKIDPTFTKAQKIFEALTRLEKKEEIKAEEIMNNRLVSVSSFEDIKNAITKMRKLGISQMPVIEDHKAIGTISESIVLDALLDSKGKKVEDIMEDAPPIVSRKASIKLVSDLLRHYPLVIVSKTGKLVGVITKADLLGKLYRN
ncbi:CBS domain-containing protein [Candidatus Woesearchaeota archaeon]|nr:CBS domain-containing protein [Candidatus Woesearchaeota archaeon]